MAEKNDKVTILEVRNKRTSIYIHYTKGSDDYKLTCHDNPRKSFYEALDDLVPAVMTLAELDKSEKSKVTATGITVREKGDNVQALIVAQKKLKRNGRVLNLATPILSLYEDKENEGSDHMTDKEATSIEQVIKEAKKYIAGDRAQGQIEFEAPKKTKKDDSTAEFPDLTDPGAQA